uniref:Uncharacterized protein n=1 Tax=Chromera velia CCMP2878 TaxID=1169474 RepID=A0A0G4FJ99_9ALVE|eukprot:Cvel_3365.t1-p1 / transcript=Cvel_3365.t1 / gene=Cvel_3365 / organism=Chromera_velia_CCMP2878 / gene_product=hypothetical protein / transcript_product=hypothetical protein / location=Cvel_scaffold134:89711-96458(-) / protein_length=597 / sequence_SO=supercontig / SO=protein_coding / is_pseudo=false
MGARTHFLPRVEASRWAATQGVATTRGSARICSGGEEGVGGAGLEWKLRASVLSRLCLNVDVCNQHIGSRPAPRFHEEGSHELTGEDVDQGADSGTRAQVVLDEQELPDWRDVDETGAWGDLGGTFVLHNLGYLSAAQREVVGHACPACRRVSSVGGLTSFSLCVQPLQTPIAPLEVDWDASPSADPWERPEETFALQNMRPKDDVCPYLFATPRQEPLAIAGAPLDGHASPAGPCVWLERNSKGSKVAESSLGPKGAAWELLPAALHTPTLLPDDRDSARGSSIPPTEWTLSREARNRLVHAYNGNAWQGLDVEYRQWLISRGFDEAGFNDSSIQNKIALSDQYNASRTATAGPCVWLERNSKGSKVAESSLGPKGAAWELLPAALHTPTLLPDDRDSARGSSIPPTEWTLSREARNRLVHAYNGNAWQGLDVEYRQWLISRGFDEAGFNDSSIQNKIALSDQYNASRTATADGHKIQVWEIWAGTIIFTILGVVAIVLAWYDGAPSSTYWGNLGVALAFSIVSSSASATLFAKRGWGRDRGSVTQTGTPSAASGAPPLASAIPQAASPEAEHLEASQGVDQAAQSSKNVAESPDS